MPVPTTTDMPNEQPWPTQPMPRNARGVMMEPFCFTYRSSPMRRTATSAHDVSPAPGELGRDYPERLRGIRRHDVQPAHEPALRPRVVRRRRRQGQAGGRYVEAGPGPDRPGFTQSRGQGGSGATAASAVSRRSARTTRSAASRSGAPTRSTGRPDSSQQPPIWSSR
jgi:hypothetical protein